MFSFLRVTTPMEPATGRANTVPALLMAGIAMLGVSMAGLMAVSIAAHAEDPVPVEITTVGLVCDGQFEVITGGVDTQAEEMFDGPVLRSSGKHQDICCLRPRHPIPLVGESGR